MPAKIFLMEARQDGGARLALSSKPIGRSGIQRISCDLPQDGVLQLVLFAEALNLRKRFGNPAATDVALDGLRMSYDPDQRDLMIERQAGYSTQEARLSVKAFQAEMAAMAELCIARAEASKHGPSLKHLLQECAVAIDLHKLLGQDEADLVRHHLREIALLMLAQEASAKGSTLARDLRAKKSQEQARLTVVELVSRLATELLPVPA